jgi:Tfp pilus assembly protein FimT
MRAGFTLLEISLVIAIVIILMGFIVPLGFDFYKREQLGNQAQQILQTLRRAQLKSIAVELDSSFGVYFDNNNKKYILFKGNFYSEVGRDTKYDEIFDLPQVITISGPSEVVFSKFEGEPNVTGDVVLSSNNDSRTININKMGRISLE